MRQSMVAIVWIIGEQGAGSRKQEAVSSEQGAGRKRVVLVHT